MNSAYGFDMRGAVFHANEMRIGAVGVARRTGDVVMNMA
jgi:hypothetical protein